MFPPTACNTAGTFDLVLCTASAGDLDWNMLLDLVKPRGKYCSVGLPPKDTPMCLSAQSFIRSEKAILGSYLGPHAYYQEMLDFSAAHGIKPKIEMLPASEVNRAVEMVRRNEARYRMVLCMPGQQGEQHHRDGAEERGAVPHGVVHARTAR